MTMISTPELPTTHAPLARAPEPCRAGTATTQGPCDWGADSFVFRTDVPRETGAAQAQ